MHPAQFDLDGQPNQGPAIRVGDRYSFPFQFIDDETEQPFPVDVTWVAKVGDIQNQLVVVEFTCTVSGDDDNVVTITLTAEQTAELVPGKYAWDLKDTDNDDTWVEGKVRIDADVSR